MPRHFSPAIQLQPRDIALLRGLFESRLMTLSHIAEIHFDGSWEAAKKRTQKLRAAGLLAERPRKLYQPTILHLTARSLRLLSQQGHLRAYPAIEHIDLYKRIAVSSLTLEHELEVLDIKAKFAVSLRQQEQLRLNEFCTWPVLFQFKASHPDGGTMIVRADAFIRVRQGGLATLRDQVFFLEVDRSTEPLDTLAQRAVAYREFYKRGGMALWNGQPASEYEAHPFRVLIVVQNDEQRNNVAQRLLHCSPPILSQVWLTTFSEIMQNALGSIWITPDGFRKALRDTEFSAQARVQTRIYRRRQERERLVADSIVKRTLFQT